MANNISKKFFRLGRNMIITIILTLIITVGYIALAAFTEPTSLPSASDQDYTRNILGANNSNNDFNSSSVVANANGSIIERLNYIKENLSGGYPGSGFNSSSLTEATCNSAANWQWFEDANGDGDTTDPEDGLCVATTTVSSGNLYWNGNGCATQRDNTYIAAYTCSGTFPTGTVASYSGINSSCTADNTWNSGDCALCQADCYDGVKNLPDQGGYTTGNPNQSGGFQGPITRDVLFNWQGTRLPTVEDFYGFCGATSGDSEGTSGDGGYHASGASSVTTIGLWGHNIGRSGEYMDLSNSPNDEWLAGQYSYAVIRVAGDDACSRSSGVYQDDPHRFRAIFRP